MKHHVEAKSSGNLRGLPFVFLCFLVGALFVYFGIDGVRTAIAKPSLESVNQKRAEFASWPSVKGHLDRVDIISFTYTRTRQPSGTDFWPEVKYRYQVANHSYTGDCLRKELSRSDTNRYFCSDPLSGLSAAKSKLTNFLPPNAPDQRQRKDADYNVYSYFPKRTVDVYYDPKNPKSSMLDHDWEPESWGDYYSDEIFYIGFSAFISILMFSVSLFCIFLETSARDSTQQKPHLESNTLPKSIPVEEQWKIDTTIQNPQHHTEEVDQS